MDVRSLMSLLTTFLGLEVHKWDGLKVGFGLNVFTAFDSLPRTKDEAVAAGWVPDKSVQCGSGSFYNGNRYVKGTDKAAMLLFDVNGYIAGIQAGIPKTQKYPGPNIYKAFNEEQDLWVTTAYFVEPATICTIGRSEVEYRLTGTGTMLAFQTGKSPASVMRIPLEEKDITTTKFVLGKCFFFMGVHYWYNQTVDMSCDHMFPAFLLYNDGKLNGFGWAFNPVYQTSKRWEHPTPNQFGRFMNPTPTCLLEQGHAVTTLHVYLDGSEQTNFC